jgi:hypothetical protein
MTRMTRIALALFVLVATAGVRAEDAVDLTGTWILQVDTSAGSGTPTFVFKQTGDTLEGTYDGTFGKVDNVTGKVTGNKATWSFTADAQGTQLNIEYSGTVDKDTMKGTVTLGALGEGTFTGKRKK